MPALLLNPDFYVQGQNPKSEGGSCRIKGLGPGSPFCVVEYRSEKRGAIRGGGA